jgi:hypothetical protein
MTCFHDMCKQAQHVPCMYLQNPLSHLRYMSAYILICSNAFLAAWLCARGPLVQRLVTIPLDRSIMQGASGSNDTVIRG